VWDHVSWFDNLSYTIRNCYSTTRAKSSYVVSAALNAVPAPRTFCYIRPIDTTPQKAEQQVRSAAARPSKERQRALVCCLWGGVRRYTASSLLALQDSAACSASSEYSRVESTIESLIRAAIAFWYSESETETALQFT
jgi:hypothetical protein